MQIKTLKTLFFTLGLFVSQVSLGQGTISGQILNAADNSPVAYATVALYQKSDSVLMSGALTESDGSFQLSDIASGQYYLEASFMGFQKLAYSVVIDKLEDQDLGILLLAPQERFLEEVVVTGEQFTVINKIDRQVFAADKFGAAKGGTATDLLRTLPSLTVGVNGDISVRGASGFVVMLDGKPLQMNASDFLNQLPANSVENIEIITAPSARYDPEGKGGLINIITKKGAIDGTYFQSNIRYGLPSIESYDNAETAHRRGADIAFNFRKKSWDISAGISYLRNDVTGRRVGDVYTILNDTLTQFPSDGERSFDESNFSGRLTIDYTLSKSDRLTFGGYLGKRSKDRTADILYFNNTKAIASTGEFISDFTYFNENLRIRNGDFAIARLDHSHDFANGGKVNTSILYEYTLLGGPTTNVNLDPIEGAIYQNEFNTNDNPLHGQRFQIDYTSKPFNAGTISLGYQFRNLDHTGDFVYERENLSTGVFELVPEFSSEVDLQRVLHSSYAQLDGGKNKWNYSVGLRIEVMDRELALRDKTGEVDTLYTYDFVKPFPSANLGYKINDGLLLKAAYSRRVERTTTFKMNPFPEREHSETLEQGDPTLRPEFIDAIEVGLLHEIGANTYWITGYSRIINNLVNRVNTVYNDSILNRIYSNVGKGVANGFEIGTEVKVNDKINSFLSGNLYRYTIDGRFDNRPINNSTWIYSINTNLTWKTSKSSDLQWTFNYLSERNTAQGRDSRFISPNLTFRKSFGSNWSATVQWLNMDMGLLSTNEQRISTWRDNEFFTTTNYIYEVDRIMLNLTYTFNGSGSKAKFIDSEFGKKEF